MLKLRKILLCNYIYYLILLIVLLISLIKIIIPNKTKYKITDTKITGIVTKINIKNNKTKIIVKGKENVIVNYKNKIKLNLGDKIEINGELKIPNSYKNENTFNYKKYLYHKKIFYIMNANYIKKISHNKNIYYLIKNRLIKKLNNNPYLYTFIIGDKSLLDKRVTRSYQKNGVSHLFAISGMHITLLSSIILKILKKIKVNDNKCYFITSIILIFYLLVTGLSPSILRGVLFFILFSINKVYYFYIKPTNIFILALSISLLINEEYLFDIGFWYSFSISLSLIIMSKKLVSKNYLISLFKVSIISLIVSIPINLYNFYEINIFSIINNLYFVPFISYIIFPLSILTLFIPFLLPIYNLFISILEKSSLILEKIDIFTYTFPKLNIIIYLIYILIIILVLYKILKNNNKYIVILFIFLIIHYIYPYFNNETYIKMIDIGQGDSILIHSRNKNILIDTGGILGFNNKFSLANNITIPLLKSLGIRKLDYLIITHGDMDHIGEGINLVNNFKVERVIFNIGTFNKLERNFIKELNNKSIPYYQNIDTIKFDKYVLYILNTRDYHNENDNSVVIYTVINNKKILLMGDAEKEKELDIIEKYNIKNIDILKVGHHGSDTSSVLEFVKVMNPSTCLISVGENNRYGHPKDIVINRLNNYCNIYRTDKDGSINIRFLKDKYLIKMYN